MSDPIVVEEYERMPEAKRLAFLDSRIHDSTDLSEHFLLEALRSEDEPTARWYLVKGLGLHQSVAAIPQIIRICREQDVDLGHTTLHRICARALGRIGEPALPHVIELLKEEDAGARSCAADALGEIKNPSVVSLLCDVLEHDQRRVALWAALSLAKLGELALPCLHGILNRTQGDIRYLALDAILKIARQESLEVVSDVLRSGETEEKLLVLQHGRAFYIPLADTIRDLTACSDPEIAHFAQSALASNQPARGRAPGAPQGQG